MMLNKISGNVLGSLFAELMRAVQLKHTACTVYIVHKKQENTLDAWSIYTALWRYWKLFCLCMLLFFRVCLAFSAISLELPEHSQQDSLCFAVVEPRLLPDKAGDFLLPDKAGDFLVAQMNRHAVAIVFREQAPVAPRLMVTAQPPWRKRPAICSDGLLREVLASFLGKF